MNYSEIKSIVNNKESLVVYFCYKNEDDQYISLAPHLTSNVGNKIIEIITSNIDLYSNQTQSDYNQVGSLDDTVELCSINDYPIVNQLLNTLNVTHSGGIKAQDVTFLIYEVTRGDSRVFFLRRHNRLSSFRSKGFMAKISDNHFDTIQEEDFLGIDGNIDLIIYDNDIAILYHAAFERIFDLSDGFKEAADLVLSNNLFDQKIHRFENLKNDILQNMNYVKRVSKLRDNGTSLLFLNDIELTKGVINQFNLDIDTNSDNTLIYRDRSQLGNFINLMQDAYYKTLIGKEEGIDERR